jgi:DNA-binding response OmpR family regulator
MRHTQTRSGVDQSPLWLALRRPDHPAVLIAERDSATREAFADDLAALQCDSFAARDDHDLERKAVDLWPHVIVMDVTREDAARWSVVARLQRSSWTSGIRIIAVSEDPTARDEAFANGCDAFLCKPIAPHVLRAQIRALIDPRETRLPAFANTSQGPAN